MIYAFDEFEADDDLYELRWRGVRVGIQPKSLDLLVCLLRHHGRVVLRRELLDEVWNGLAISDNAITQAIMCARRAIEREGQPPAIATVRGRGYRFVPDVRLVRRSVMLPARRVVLLAEPVTETEIATALGHRASRPRFVVDAAGMSSEPFVPWISLANASLSARVSAREREATYGTGNTLDFVLGAFQHETALVLSNIDRADASSLLLLGAVARGLVTLDAFIVATYTPTEPFRQTGQTIALLRELMVEPARDAATYVPPRLAAAR